MLASMLNGRIARRELTRGMISLGCFLSEADIDTIFEVYDANSAGTVSLNELNAGVERSIQALEAEEGQQQARREGGGGGSSARRSGRKTEEEMHHQRQEAHRTRVKMKRRGHSLNFFKFATEDEGMSVQDQLRKALSRQHSHVIELFREWDTSADGNISMKEFDKGVRRLGYQGDSAAIEQLFGSWDTDSSGAISLVELRSILKRGGTVKVPAYLKRVAVDAEKERVRNDEHRAHTLADKLSRKMSVKTMHEQSASPPPARLNREHDKILVKIREQKKKLMGQVLDQNHDGFVTRAELQRALPGLGIKADKKTLETLFDTMDPDKTGRVPTNVLERALRFASSSHLKMSKGVKIDPTSDVPVHEQIKNALAANTMRVIDFFREWDLDGSGTIDKDEFAKGLQTLGLDASRETYNELFDDFDRDGSGEITLREFKSALKKVSKPKEEVKAAQGQDEAQLKLHDFDELRRDVMRECSRLVRW